MADLFVFEKKRALDRAQRRYLFSPHGEKTRRLRDLRAANIALLKAQREAAERTGQ